MKLLNRDYGIFIRSCMAFLGYVAVLLITGHLKLAHEIAKRFWFHNEFKIAVRRCAWYCRRGWPRIDVLSDEFFDPTEGLEDTQLDELEAFVKKRQPKLSPVIYASDLAIIAARRLNNNSIPTQRSSNIVSFQAACDQMLAAPVSTDLTASGPDGPRTGDFPIVDAITTLADFADLFPAKKMRWFVISGTFLGLVREKGFLAHDYDIDLGVFENEIDIKSTIADVEASRLFVLKKYDHHMSTLLAPRTPSTNPDVPYILKLVHVTGIHIDLFIHYHDTSTDPAVDWHGSSLHRWENSAFDLTPYPFYDMNVLGPADADRYLTENYGDWRTPVTDFNCTTDTPNLALVAHPVAIVFFIKRYIMARGTNTKQAAKLERELLQNGFLLQSDDGCMTVSGALFEA
ncbi:MAG: hypothetical protein ABJO29_00510 [Yoonia sp.]|uniref:hypothetical protein n=1 Tax=Yoonia sp. TaxID=2212373 RepID=UPI003265D578